MTEDIRKPYRPNGYTDADQRSDTSFLVGVRYGRLDAYRTAQRVLAGEDTVEWARAAKGSSLALSYAIELLDDLIEEIDQ